jgi:hypothetical protein
VTAAVNTLRTEDRDTHLHTLFFPWLGPGTGHPSTAQAGVMAAQLKSYLDSLPYDVWSDGAPAATGFRTWANAQGFALLHAAEASPWADPDNDGILNLQEYAFGGNALGADAGAVIPLLAASEATPGALSFRFRRAAADLSYRVESTTSLSPPNWQPAPWSPVPLGGGVEEVLVPAPLPANLYLRVLVQ